MTALELLGYVASLLIGVSLGLIGGGGSLLTVPVLVYLLGVAPVLATAYSLFVVGATSLVGAFSFMKKGLVEYRTALVFALPSLVSVGLIRHFLLPAIPDPLFTMGSFALPKDTGLMVVFALVMVMSSVTMMRNKQCQEQTAGRVGYPYLVIGLQGAGVGVLTGIVGAGGGFLIIPALVLLARLPMKLAVGTSLLIIAINSLIGFLADVAHQAIRWDFMLLFTALPVVGIAMGSYLSGKINGDLLKKAFGGFVLLMGVYILLVELVF